MKIKKFFYCFFSLFFSIYLALFLPQFCISFALSKPLTNYIYARVNLDSSYLYKNPSTDSVYFVLPQSYFVLLLSNFNKQFYRAQYKDIVGFVLKTDVSPVNETPQNPYPENIKFRVFTSDGTDVLSSPFLSRKPNVIEKLPTLSYVNYYGFLMGEEQIKGRGRIWYFGKTSNNNYGYLYSGLCDELEKIPTNTESVTPLSNPFEESDNSYLYDLITISPAAKILIITLLSIPALILVWLLFKPFKDDKKLKNKSIKQPNSKVIKEIQDITDDTL